MVEETKDVAEDLKDEAEYAKDKTEHPKYEATKALFRYLVKKYAYPRDWAFEVSIFFKVLAVNYWRISPLIEGGAGSMGSSTERNQDYPIGLMKLLKDLSTDRHLQDIIAEIAANARKLPVAVDDESSDEERETQNVKLDLDDTTTLNFKTNSAYMVRRTKNSALRSLTVNIDGRASVTITVRKKDGATASVNNNSNVDA